MTKSEGWLTVLLRVGGVVTGSAIVAVFLPTATMETVHAGLGLGELPAAPITEYLTRSLSAMYALHGLVLLALSVDVGRHLAVVSWVGGGTAALGVLQIGIDVTAPLPVWWVVAEGPWMIAAGLAIVWLARRAGAERRLRRMDGVPFKPVDERRLEA